MVDGVNQQPGIFQRIGNFFGAGNANAGQRTGTPFFPEDPNAGQRTDPFAGLSRAQRTMLGFAALRDAAAALEGRDSNFFAQSLGGFEQARERERLRVQGAEANRNQQIQNAINAAALARAMNDPGLMALANAQLQALGSTATPTEAITLAAGGAMPSPSATPTTVAPSTRPVAGGAVMDATGAIVSDVGAEPLSPTAQAAMAGAPAPAAPATTTPAISPEVADLDRQLADINAQIEGIIAATPDRGQTAAASFSGFSIDDPQAQRQFDRLQEQEATLRSQREALVAEQAAAEAARIAGEDDARQAGYYVNLIESVMNDPALEGVLGRIEGRADPRGATGAALFGDAEMDILGKLEQLGGAAFLQAFESLKGGGQITQIEGDKATRAITRLDQRAVSPEAYRSALEELRQVYANAQARARGQELPFPEINVEGAAPSAGASQTPQISSDAEYDALPSGAQFIDPEGVLRRKP